MTQDIRTWSDPADIVAPIVDSYQLLYDEETQPYDASAAPKAMMQAWARVMATFRWPAVDLATSIWHCMYYRGISLKRGIGNAGSVPSYLTTANTPTAGSSSVTVRNSQGTATTNDVRIIPAGSYFQVWGATTAINQEPDPTIYRTTADAFCGNASKHSGLTDVAALYHDQDKYIYFTRTSPTNSICRMNWDGSGITTIKTLSAVPRGICVDTTAGKIYWLEDTPALKSCDLDGANTATVLVLNASSQPRGMDINGGYLYWCDTWSNTVNRCTTAGAGFTNLISSGLSDPYGIKINAKVGYNKIYISDPGDGKIKYANLDGTGLTDGSTGHGSLLGGLDIDTSRAGAGVMYFVVGDEVYYWYISYFSPVVIYSSPDNVNQTDVCVDRTRSCLAVSCNGDDYIRIVSGEGDGQANLKFEPVSTARWAELGSGAGRLYFFVPTQITASKPNATEMREIVMEAEYETAHEIVWSTT